MARELIRRWRLAVLEVRLDLAQRSTNVVTSLSTFDGDNQRQLWTRSASLAEFGIGPHPPYSLSMPDDLIRAVERSMLDDLDSEAALWIHLVPFYGLLGAVPWEHELIAATGLPIFRVPDRLPMPVVRGLVWFGAIAIDAGLRTTWAAPYVSSLIDQWRMLIPARVEVDVFADARTANALRRLRSEDAAIRIHGPDRALSISHQRTPRRSAAPNSLAKLPPEAVGGSVWADWIAQGLSGRAVRALHIALDGSWDGSAPVLLISQDPGTPSKRGLAAMVGVTDLMQFVQSIGAATVSFGAPPDGLDDVAVRTFADTVGQQRPGATMFSGIADDRDGRQLAAAEAFLVDPGGEMPVPRHPSLFVYAQPERLQPIMRERWPRRTDGSAPAEEPDTVEEALRYQTDSTLADRFEQAATVPSWVASSGQYLGAQWAGLAETESNDIPMGETRMAYDTGAKSALYQIRDIVERHARPSS